MISGGYSETKSFFNLQSPTITITIFLFSVLCHVYGLYFVGVGFFSFWKRGYGIWEGVGMGFRFLRSAILRSCD